MSYVDAVHVNSEQVAARLSTLEMLFDEKTHDPETLKAHMDRDMALNAGARARGMYEHAAARNALDVAEQGFASVQDQRYVYGGTPMPFQLPTFPPSVPLCRPRDSRDRQKNLDDVLLIR